MFRAQPGQNPGSDEANKRFAIDFNGGYINQVARSWTSKPSTICIHALCFVYRSEVQSAWRREAPRRITSSRSEGLMRDFAITPTEALIV
ncbi:hypothetical protein Y1Q_0023384 [Alligator mississippiensis]|uniref:Uncharacterized protein n=1 Tax=Alligator mississippiensis TaxID=8496 RepID=A0A151NPG7_ALLMI|nr:hypothetical protein Y1Q_0023384 [Alligator mississippiensis]